MAARARTEIIVAFWGALTFGAVLASYFVFRPVRDALVLDGKPDDIPALFTATFVTVAIASSGWNALLARGGRRRYVPIAFHAFAAMWLAFAALVHSGFAPVAVGRVFYVWSAVFNLFVVSVFWSLLADLVGPTIARRVYGPIAAGGTAGALLGPMLTGTLVEVIGVPGIILLSAALLELAALALGQLRRAGERLERTDAEAAREGEPPPEPGFAAALVGLRQVMRSRYLLAIAGYVMCTATAATFLYLEQAAVAKELLPTREARTELFATIDLWTNTGTFVAQTLLAAPLLAWVGPGIVLLALPLVQGVGISLYATAPSLMVLAGVQIGSRIATHGLTRPARELLFTVIERDAKYRAKNVIDTTIYRFGDFSSAWLQRGLTALAGNTALVAAMLPLVVAWMALATVLGAGFRRLTASAAAARAPAAPAPTPATPTQEPA